MSDLDSAPAHIKLAVDLIMLLEQNDIPPQIAIDALEIVSNDCRRKLNTTASQSEENADG